MLAVTNPSNDKRAGVKSDTKFWPDAKARFSAFFQGAHFLLKIDGGATGLERRILYGNRGAEQRHQAIASYILDGAAMRVDRFAHAFDDVLHERKYRLFADTFRSWSIIGHIGKQDCNLPSLALTPRLIHRG